MLKKYKLALIGAGNIGGVIAQLSMIKDLADVVLFDINEGLAKGKALDIAQCSSLHSSSIKLTGTSSYADIQGADVVVVTAGVARKPGMSRDDLLSINSGVMKDVGENIAKYAPQAFVICVTNPLDVMVEILQQYSKLPTNKVVGMAGVLDSARFVYFLSQALGVSIKDVDGFVLGGHGDTMVPVLDYTTISGIPLAQLIKSGKITQEAVDKIVDRTRSGGGEIVNLLGTGSAFFAPASSVMAMVESYIKNQKRVLPAASFVKGKYGLDGMYVGVPVIIGSEGVEEIIEIELDAKAKTNFEASIKAVKELMEAAKKLMK